MDLQNSLLDVIYRLGFTGLADVSGPDSYVTLGELYQWLDEAAKKLSSLAGVFVTVDASITVVPGNSTYALPANFVYGLAVFLGSRPLRITSQAQLEALEGQWSAAVGPAARASFDAREVGFVVLYPQPTAGGVLSLVCQEFPSTIQAGSTTISLPTVFQDYFSYAQLAGARGKESDARMEEISNHAQARVDLYVKVATHLYGRGQ